MAQTSRQELVRRVLKRWNAGERAIDLLEIHPDVVFHSGLTNTTYRGHEGLLRWMAEVDEQFEAWHSSVDEFREVGEERLLALGSVHLKGRTSGVEFDQPMSWLITFAGDHVTELRTIPDHVQALEAAGLSA
jgi:ketosteroid isomerase-like protein